MRVGFGRRLPSVTAALVSAVFVVLVFAGAPATAKTLHVFSGTFSGTGANALSEPSDVAVSNATGDVYVVDRGHDRVEEFDPTGATVLAEFNGTGAPTGTFSAPRAIAVDNSTNLVDPSAGDVYVTDTGHGVIDKFSSTGAYIGQVTTGAGGAALGGLDGVAIDGEGIVWVYQASGEIDNYSNAMTNEFLTSRHSPFEASPGFAVDSGDNLYVNRGAEIFAKLDASGNALSPEVDNARSTGASVDLSSNAVYIDNATTIGMFTANGEPLETFGSGHLVEGTGLAVNYSLGSPVSGSVYVADTAANDVTVFAAIRLPDVSVEPVANLTTTTVTLNGTVNPDNAGNVVCMFEYGTSASYGSTTPCSPAPGSGGAPVPVTASLTGLASGTTYHYRLSATNIDETRFSEDQQFRTLGPSIHLESAEHVQLTSAKLRALVNPQGSDTSYHFEYDTSPYDTAAPHGQSLPVPNVDIGSGSTDMLASAILEALQPGTTYHYRVVIVTESAPGEHETLDGPDETFLTPTGSCANEQARAEQPYALGLPDCRAFERVSPAAKDDNDVENNSGSARASVSGDGLIFSSPGSFAEPKGSLGVNHYLSARGAAGWSTKSLTPRYRAIGSNSMYSFESLTTTPDLSRWLTASANTPLTSDSPAGYINLYLQNTVDGEYRALTTSPTYERPYDDSAVGATIPIVGGASTDLSRVVFQESTPFTPDSRPYSESGNPQQIYEWADGSLKVVDLPPEGSFSAFPGSDYIGASIDENAAGDVWHAVSDDGSRVFFTASEGRKEGGETRQNSQGQLYLREVDAGRTVEVSVSQRSVPDPGGRQPARFWAASPDGSRVFFTSCEKLTDDATAVSVAPGSGCEPEDDGEGQTVWGIEKGAGNDLYEYDVGTGNLIDLTVDSSSGDPRGAGVLGVVTASEDGSYVYFVAEGDLAGSAISGEPNLYVRHGGETRLIGALGRGRPGGPHGLNDGTNWGMFGVETGGPASHSARVSADGKRLVFASEMSLTGYDNVPVESRDCSVNDRCREIYSYDAQSGRLTCVSCNPSGARPVGPSNLAPQVRVFGAAVGGSRQTFAARNLSEDGRRLFFESKDALVPHDSNGQADVYEYENGHVYLVSDGAGNFESTFLDASASGDDVFIATADQLLPEDRDGNIDVYDVRTGGGFPVSISTPACDNGDACKPPVSSQPAVFGAPASATFSGAGNVPPRLQAKPKTKVKPKHKRKRKQRRGHKPGNAGRGASGRVKRS